MKAKELNALADKVEKPINGDKSNAKQFFPHCYIC